ncbi:MAG: large conductance mechanosensitive channel protein MscL [Clostridia bacterium]|nr:large conductance mechanosensitive channel protein MscL [Clostridia bacterium]
MKNFFAEFKKFITRGNVIDMAVGVTVGSAFTAIVNGLTNYILKPIINWVLALILGADSLSELFTFLKKSYVLDEAGNATAEIDLATSIYIDWGAFINAVLNFFIIAFVLFSIVKIINNLREGAVKASKGKLTKEEKKELKAAGIKLSDKEAVKAFLEEKAAKEAEAKAAEEAAAAEAARVAAENSTEGLLKQILATLKEDK